LTFAAALLLFSLAGAPAMAQSREETVDFLFRGGRVETSDVKIYITDEATIKEETCVIDISGKIAGSRFARYSVRKAPNPLAALGGHDYDIKVDFNKLLPNVMNEKEITTLGAAYSGTPPPQVRDGVVNSSSELTVSYLEDDDVGAPKLARLPNAFKYFIASFCPGKKSAY
jgi:hypothetical protein